MSDLNTSQQLVAETLDGMIAVDAGPGTGKTYTVVERYVNLIKNNTDPRKIILLTFTNSAAMEMEERIKHRLIGDGMEEIAKNVQVRTFDSFCYSVVMESPDNAGRLFGLKKGPTHSVRMEANQSLSFRRFETYLDEFLLTNGEKYGDSALIISHLQRETRQKESFFKLITKLMTLGIYPIKYGGWFGGDDGKNLLGNPELALSILKNLNKTDALGKDLYDYVKKHDVFNPPVLRPDNTLEDCVLEETVYEDRTELIKLIHDVYVDYIERSISDDCITFGLNAMFAFSVMYTNKTVREQNRFDYIIIDEFQDTDAGQLMMCLMMIRDKPNVCVVGDWKQGIYGFRNTSIENLVNFDDRILEFSKLLNGDGNIRCPTGIPKAKTIPLTVNYRSSQLIIDKSLASLVIDQGRIPVPLASARADEIGSDTHIRAFSCPKRNMSYGVATCIADYVASGKYTVHDKTPRNPEFGDIAVLCSTNAQCAETVECLNSHGIPAFLQGDMEIFSGREGKLLLAWLRYVMNENDPWGYVPIMADLGAPLSVFLKNGDKIEIPAEISEQRKKLEHKKRRINNLITSIFDWYGLDNDVTQAIVSVLSKAYTDSLLTIPDIVSMIERDIEREGARYDFDADLSLDAVRVMTVHKAKGLEFPIVILREYAPGDRPNSEPLRFDNITGIRCTKTVGRYPSYTKICDSWKTALTKNTEESKTESMREKDRLMLVAMSRAMQYITLIRSEECKNDKCATYLTAFDLQEKSIETLKDLVKNVPHSSNETAIEKPDLSGYSPIPSSIGIHELMRFPKESKIDTYTTDEDCGKGMDYGREVHREAADIARGLAPSGRYPESAYVEKVLARRNSDGFRKMYSEIKCRTPLPSLGVTMSGIIDLLLIFDDGIEIHDYKTDVTDRYENEYRFQLSIYALAASEAYGLPARCYIDYVSQNRTTEFEPMSVAEIEAIARKRMEETQPSEV